MAVLTNVAPIKDASVKNDSESEITSSDTARLIDHVEVDIEVMLGGARITIAELNALTADTVIPLDRQVNEAADISINGRVIARGEVVTVNDCFAVRVTEIPGR